jgi:hypothetical protein
MNEEVISYPVLLEGSSTPAYGESILVNKTLSPCLTCGGLCESLEQELKNNEGFNPLQIELYTPDELPPLVYESLSTTHKFTWDAYENNVIYAKVNSPSWEGRYFGLHLFEEIFVPANGPVRYKNTRLIDADLFEWERLSDGSMLGHISQVETVDFETTITIKVANNKVIVQGSITNREDYDWPCGWALFCYRARINPDFWDYEGYNVFVSSTGSEQLLSMADIDPTFEGQFGAMWGFVSADDNPTGCFSRTHEPYVWKYNLEDSLRLRGQTEPTKAITGNRNLNLSCIHPNVRVAVASGETQTYCSVLELQLGSNLPDAEISPQTVYFSEEDVLGGNYPTTRIVTIYNGGSSDLRISDAYFTGPDSPHFGFESLPSTLITIEPESSLSLTIKFNPQTEIPKVGMHADLIISTNDPVEPMTTINVIGAVTPNTVGEWGSYE